MPRPGIDIFLQDTGGTVSVPSDTGTLFVTGLTERGPLAASLIQSLDEFVALFGDRQSWSSLYDYLDEFFHEGGDRAWVSRVVGPSATSGAHNLLDGSSAVSLTVTAIGPGAWSSGYKVQVLAGSVGGTYVIQVQDTDGNVLEDSGNLATQLDAVVWSQRSDYVRITVGAATDNPAVAAATALSAGTDDRADITDTEWLNAQNLFTQDLGPGQVAQCGRTTTTAHSQLVSHAEANDRVALLDLTDSGTVSTLISSLGSANSRFAAAFAPYITIPGLTNGQYRSVPPSALIAGLVARNDPIYGANRPAAGNLGISNYAIGLSQPAWTDTDRATLSGAGVNVVRSTYGSIRVYGWRSTTDPVNDAQWVDFGNARLFTKLSSELRGVAENFVFDEIDGQNGRTIGAFHDAISGLLLTHWIQGELFGDTPDLAFSVDTGNTVNTLQTIANNELHAVAYVKMSPFAEYVAITVVKQAIA